MSNLEVFLALNYVALIVGLFLLLGFAFYVAINRVRQPALGFIDHVELCYSNRMVKGIRYLAIFVYCAVIVVWGGAAAAAVLWPPEPPDLVAADIASVDIRLDQRGSRQATQVSSSEHDKIEALTQVVRSGTRTEDHNCGDTGRISFHYTDGRRLELGILSGHDDNFYEYRVYSSSRGYSMFRVAREPFAAAMVGLGVSTLPNRMIELPAEANPLP